MSYKEEQDSEGDITKNDQEDFKYFYKWYLPANLTINQLYSGLTKSTLKIKENTLEQGLLYLFKLELTIQLSPTQNETIVSEIEIKVNQPFQKG